MGMRCTRLLTAVALLLLTAVTAPEAQPRKTVSRLGFLGSSTFERQRHLVAAFWQALRELGYVEGQNVVLEQRYAEGQFQKLPELAAELVRLRVDVLIVESAPAAHAARNATRAIPIVFTNASDPVGTGLVTSLARPGGNITGLSDFNADVVAKRLELLKEAAPTASRIAVLLNPGNPTNPPQLKLIQAAASSQGVALLPFEAREVDDIDRAFLAMRTERAEALVVVGDPMLASIARRVWSRSTPSISSAPLLPSRRASSSPPSSRPTCQGTTPRRRATSVRASASTPSTSSSAGHRHLAHRRHGRAPDDRYPRAGSEEQP
jgi:ABC-type uncharacterized transport system substrate-binding protein